MTINNFDENIDGIKLDNMVIMTIKTTTAASLRSATTIYYTTDCLITRHGASLDNTHIISLTTRQGAAFANVTMLIPCQQCLVGTSLVLHSNATSGGKLVLHVHPTSILLPPCHLGWHYYHRWWCWLLPVNKRLSDRRWIVYVVVERSVSGVRQ